ncbi:hypothetical protein [Rhodococcoides kyotonense]|uniref:LigA protein n=1 Tax=Rhodococcoides kyotonense TaxID=398843 RepID=A0A239H2T6_9NOCA|nr:hypothetical protein [Rhodococcus kyotonensis]SNS75501.1 hypothetical protein SAMN05421642_10556 [Rhodococcus kyotonensis]
MISGNLLIADYRADRFDVVSLAALVSGVDSLVLSGRGTVAEHAGVLSLPAGAPRGLRWAFVDDLRGALVVGDDHGEVARYPIPIPAEHLATDVSGRFVVGTTGCGVGWEPFSDLVGWCDLETGETRTVRVRVGEPGVAVGGTALKPLVALRHRAPGSVEVLNIDTVANAGAHAPVVRGPECGLGDDGHGDAIDPQTGRLVVATGRGLETFTLTESGPTPAAVLPWPVPGRAYYLRVDPVMGRICSVVRGHASATEWHTWRNWLVAVDIATGDWDVTEVSAGLAFRPDVWNGEVVCPVIHPDGDTLWRVRGSVHSQSPLPPMTAGPRPGVQPWDGTTDRPAQRRATAHLGSEVAVTRGGDGVIDIVDESGAVRTVAVNSPLHEGGVLARLPEEPARAVDGVAR